MLPAFVNTIRAAVFNSTRTRLSPLSSRPICVPV
jgi:hypothetical protein